MSASDSERGVCFVLQPKVALTGDNCATALEKMEKVGRKPTNSEDIYGRERRFQRFHLLSSSLLSYPLRFCFVGWR